MLYSISDAVTDPPIWTSVPANKVRGFSTSRGRNSELDEIDAGTATVLVDNRDRTFDPVINTSIRPLNRWWIRTQFNGETHDIFKGYAQLYDQSWPSPGFSDALAIVSCVDEFKVLALDKLPVMNPPRDDYENLVAYDSPTGYWRFTDDTNGSPGPALTVSNVGLSIVYETPIVGEGVGFRVGGCLELQSTWEVYTGASDAGDPFDAEGLSEITVETWFKTSDATPGSDTFIAKGAACAVGLQFQLYITTTGTIKFALSNGAANTTATSSTSLLDNTWYHIVGTVSGGFIRIYINGSQVGAAAWSSTIGAFGGTPIPSFQLGSSSASGITMRLDEVAFYRLGLDAGRVVAHYQAGVQRGFIEQRSDVRVGAVLDSVSSHAPRRLGTGTRNVYPAFMHGQSPLEELRTATGVELSNGVFFVSKAGELVFLANDHRSSSPYNTVQATFDDDGTDLPYQDLDLDYSESFLLNDWNITRDGGLVQNAFDATSIARYFKRSQSLSGLKVISDAAALSIAQSLRDKYKDPLTRILSITLTTADVNVADAIFRRDLGDKIRVLRTPPGGGARIDQSLWIQKIDTEGTPDGPWRVTWGVSPV